MMGIAQQLIYQSFLNTMQIENHHKSTENKTAVISRQSFHSILERPAASGIYDYSSISRREKVLLCQLCYSRKRPPWQHTTIWYGPIVQNVRLCTSSISKLEEASAVALELHCGSRHRD